MPDTGNAVNAEWVGPSGMQLWDGTTLQPGDVVLGIGLDEAEHSPYWKVVTRLPKDGAAVADASVNRQDIAQPVIVVAPPELEPPADAVQSVVIDLTPTGVTS